MNAKEYLMQARYLDERITSKTQQIASLNELATKCTSTFSDMPKSPNHGGSRIWLCHQGGWLRVSSSAFGLCPRHLPQAGHLS